MLHIPRGPHLQAHKLYKPNGRWSSYTDDRCFTTERENLIYATYMGRGCGSGGGNCGGLGGRVIGRPRRWEDPSPPSRQGFWSIGRGTSPPHRSAGALGAGGTCGTGPPVRWEQGCTPPPPTPPPIDPPRRDFGSMGGGPNPRPARALCAGVGIIPFPFLPRHLEQGCGTTPLPRSSREVGAWMGDAPRIPPAR